MYLCIKRLYSSFRLFQICKNLFEQEDLKTKLAEALLNRRKSLYALNNYKKQKTLEKAISFS